MRERCHRCGGYITRIPERLSGCAANPGYVPEEIRHDDPDDGEFCRLVAEAQEASTR